MADTTRSGAQTPWLVISPHFDDAVFSCGHWLHRHPGTVVVTVCASSPGPGIPASEEWDDRAGFGNADQAVSARRAEDFAALRILGAQQRLLGFVDAPYRKEEQDLHFENQLRLSIEALLDEMHPAHCIVPLGILHPDHIATGRAARSALSNRPECRTIAYADLPYAITHPSLVRDRIVQIQSEQAALQVEFHEALPTECAAKDQALACYDSQVRLIDPIHPMWRDALKQGAERFWRLLPMREIACPPPSVADLASRASAVEVPPLEVRPRLLT